MNIIEPKTEEEFEKYFFLRWEILRKPWNHPYSPKGDDMEDQCIHALMLDENEEAIGVCRLQFNSAEEGQIRYMAVRENQQGRGLGGKIIQFMESKAIGKGAQYMILNARENAVEFYKGQKYIVTEPSHLLWGAIPHFLMKKIF